MGKGKGIIWISFLLIVFGFLTIYNFLNGNLSKWFGANAFLIWVIGFIAIFVGVGIITVKLCIAFKIYLDKSIRRGY